MGEKRRKRRIERKRGNGYRWVSALLCRDNVDTGDDNIIHTSESYKRNPRHVTR